MRTIIIIASVILATSAFPQYAPARKEGSYEPASNSSPEKAERATRDNVKATRDPNYVPKKAPATKDSNYIPKIEPASNSSPEKAERATRDNVKATRDPN